MLSEHRKCHFPTMVPALVVPTLALARIWPFPLDNHQGSSLASRWSLLPPLSISTQQPK